MKTTSNGRKKYAVRAVAVCYHIDEVIFHCPPVNGCPLKRFAIKCIALRQRQQSITIDVGVWYQMEIEYAVRNQKTISVLSCVPAGELMDTRVVCSIAELKTTLALMSHIAAGFWHAKSEELVLVADYDRVITRSGCKPLPNDKLLAWCAPLLDPVAMNNSTQAQWKVTEVLPQEEQRPGYGRRTEGEPVARVRFVDGDPAAEEDPDHEDPFRRDARDAVVPAMHSQSFWDRSAPHNRAFMQRRESVMPSVFATRRRAANAGAMTLRFPPAGQASETRQPAASNCASGSSATAAQDDDWDLQPPRAPPQCSNVLAHFARPEQSQEAPRTVPHHGPQRVEESRSPPRNTQRAALPQRSNRITAGLSSQQQPGVAAEPSVAEGEIINFDDDDAPQQGAAQQNVGTEWSTALEDLFLSETHRSVDESGFSSVDQAAGSSNEEKDTTASSELIIDTSDSSVPAPVVLPSPMQQRWVPVHRTGCLGVIWTKRSYQYLVYSPDLEGREAFIQVFVNTRKMNVGQWLRFDATLWKSEARYTIGRYTPIDEVIHAMPMLDSIVITCDVRVTGDANGELPLVESDFFGRVEDPYSLATRLRSGLHSVNLVYSNEQKAAATGRWSLCFVND